MASRSQRGCLMCDSLYIKANGKMPCWDDVGESRVLRRLDYSSLDAGSERDLFRHPTLAYIRSSFRKGRIPFPGLCDCCDVRNHGPLVTSIQPDTMRILHIESSYLCHLSCPQCIPAKNRRTLESPPYHMPASALEALLRQLRAEGVRQIGIVHFEGRGDPLMNPQLGQMIKTTRRLYPDATTMVTTHGSYPYQPWIVESGLHVLRVSVDGAFPENYAKYRVGGDFNTVIQFFWSLRNHRLRANSPLKVTWKYILFEWNDSDDEIQHAALLAKELCVHLEFVLTHSPGRSRRFMSAADLNTALQRLAPEATTDATFPIKEQPARMSERKLRATIRGLLSSAQALIHQNEEHVALGLIMRAIEYDCGLGPEGEFEARRHLIRACLPLLETNGRFPETLAGLSGIFREWGESDTSSQLLMKSAQIKKGPLMKRLWISLRLRLQFKEAIPRGNLPDRASTLPRR